MTERKGSPAVRLARALKALGHQAQVVENGCAVEVWPDMRRLSQPVEMVWLPSDLDRAYVWGDNYQHRACLSDVTGLADVAREISATIHATHCRT